MESESNIGQPPSAGGGEAPAQGGGRGLPATQASRARQPFSELLGTFVVFVLLCGFIVVASSITAIADKFGLAFGSETIDVLGALALFYVPVKWWLQCPHEGQRYD
ncbi:hypothetical protein SAMN05444287_3120 [Octadecabacter temperatus]|uniref:Uncharacterized protein n=1 Tax=Octadecabacter temperatus TaxID=1458307 RepID=A0A0K0Y8K7_9RHOB|nr:hypothetical protein OSB_27160 [Octadecabacter temperatus]SIO44923.1 hypothetical protein SAMN05444287_3120 [Octadecabacter temperatus]